MMTLILIVCKFTFASSTAMTNEVYADLGNSKETYECPNCKGGYGTGLGYPIDGSNDEPQSSLQQTTTLLGKVIDKIPDKNFQAGLKEYVSIVNPGTYGSSDRVGIGNIGISDWFKSKFANNVCYRDAAKKFYEEVALTVSKENSCKSKIDATGVLDNSELVSSARDVYGCVDSRPSINDAAGKGDKKYLQEGWLWRLAMKHGHNSPEAALELIGMCGHDDVSQGMFHYFDGSDNAKKDINDKIKSYMTQKKELDAEIKEEFKKYKTDNNKIRELSLQAEKVSFKIKAYQGKNGKTAILNCPPPESDFYLTGSLGTNADISAELKNKINAVQNPENKNFIPAKNYHIYGSALLGCKMVSKGMKPEQAVRVQKQAARLYRGLRMCDSVEKTQSKRDSLKKLMRADIDIDNSKKFEAKILSWWNEKNQSKINCSKYIAPLVGTGFDSVPYDDNYENLKNSKNPADKNKAEFSLCQRLAFFGISKLEENEIEVVKKKISKSQEKTDAAVLYDKWYFGGSKVLGKNIPCSDIRYRGPKDLMNPEKGIFSGLSKPEGWSDERYKAATQKLATWDVDFEWTVAQHEAGSKWGADMCKPDSRKNPFADSNKQCLKSVSDELYKNEGVD